MTGRSDFYSYKRSIGWLRRLLPISLLRVASLVTGSSEHKLPLLFRYLLLSKLARKCGDVVFIGKHAVIKNSEGLSIGDRCSIHAFCYIDGCGGVNIGDDVSIAHGSSIVSFEHTWRDPGVPIKYNPIQMRSITIGNDVWIGCGVRILGGAVIGDRVVIAAGSVVKGNVESNSIYGGVPARRLGDLL